MGEQTRFIPALNHGLVVLMMKDEHLKNLSDRGEKNVQLLFFVS